MDSTQLDQLRKQLDQFRKEFSNWYTFDAQTLENVPKQFGVYVMRKASGQRFGRLNGESDILYIGKTRMHGGLNKKLRIYLYGKSGSNTEKRIRAFTKKTTIQVAWCLCDEPENLEHHLLWQYLREHDELPPLNHSITRKIIQRAYDEGVGTTEPTITKF
jgi:hypothetical protein